MCLATKKKFYSYVIVTKIGDCFPKLSEWFINNLPIVKYLYKHMKGGYLITSPFTAESTAKLKFRRLFSGLSLPIIFEITFS